MFAFITLLIILIDIDECVADFNSCHMNATCQNTHGSFNCFCNDGFSGNGTICTGKQV